MQHPFDCALRKAVAALRPSKPDKLTKVSQILARLLDKHASILSQPSVTPRNYIAAIEPYAEELFGFLVDEFDPSLGLTKGDVVRLFNGKRCDVTNIAVLRNMPEGLIPVAIARDLLSYNRVRVSSHFKNFSRFIYMYRMHVLT